MFHFFIGFVSQLDNNHYNSDASAPFTNSFKPPDNPTLSGLNPPASSGRIILQSDSRSSLPSSSPQDYARNYSTIHTLTQERAELYRQRDQARDENEAAQLLSQSLLRGLRRSLGKQASKIQELEQEGMKKDRKIKALEDEAKKRKSEDENVSTKKIKLFLELEVKVKGTQLEGIVVNEGI